MDDSSGIVVILVALFVYVPILVWALTSLMGIFIKAGQPAWAAIIPIYNLVILLQIVGKPLWWIILFFIPCVSFVAAILINLSLAKSFDRSAAFGIGLALLPLPFLPILAFGSARYQGPAG